MLLIAIFLAALFFLIKEGVPVIRALRSGVVRTRGYRPVRVERAVDPERFKNLVLGRCKLACSGLVSALLLIVTMLWDRFGMTNG